MLKQLMIVFLLSICLITVNAQIIYSEKFRIDTSDTNEIILPIRIKDVSNLFAFEMDVEYDNPNIMSYKDVEEGGFLSKDGGEVFNAKDLSLVKTGPGYVKGIAFFRFKIETGVSGSGALFFLKFNKLMDGVTDLKITASGLYGPNEENYDHDIYYLTIWYGADSTPKQIGENVDFWARLEDTNGNSIQKSCTINIEGNSNNMIYQNTLYTYSTGFNTAGSYPWSVTCDNFYTVDSTYTIEGSLLCVNGQTKLCGQTDIGLCQYGQQTCVNNEWGSCQGAILPTTEQCDSLDNDCDGEIDENLKTIWYKDNDGDNYGYIINSILSCSQPPGYINNADDCDDNNPAINPGILEVCDQIDNNCEGTIDEDCECTDGEQRICGLSEIGECIKGSQICHLGMWSECQGAVFPSQEICDGLDNDCDGEIDEGCACVEGETKECGTDTGQCQKGTQTCSNSQWSTCTGSISPVEELCDGFDNDCDEFIDEDCELNNVTCIENWDCDEWTTCIDNIKTRTCLDSNDCGTLEDIPVFREICNSCNDGVKNNGETDIDCGGPCDACVAEDTFIVDAFKVNTYPEDNKVEIIYDNKNSEKTGVFFTFYVKNSANKVLLKDYLGPVTVENYFSQEMSLPFYNLKQNTDYKLEVSMAEKGKIVDNFDSTFRYTKSSSIDFFIRLFSILFILAVLLMVIGIIFIKSVR